MSRVYLTRKKVLSIASNAEALLKGLTSNDLNQPRNAFLNIHGRIIAVFDQVRWSEDEYWIALEEGYVDDVLQHVDRYARLNGSSLRVMDHRGYFFLNQEDLDVDVQEALIPQKRGILLLSERPIESSVTDDQFTLFRVCNAIALQGVDFEHEMLLNVSETEYVSFTKGCYLGQEPIAKVHHRSQPTWKLMVKTVDDCDETEREKMTSVSQDPQTGKTMGFVFVKNSSKTLL